MKRCPKELNHIQEDQAWWFQQMAHKNLGITALKVQRVLPFTDLVLYFKAGLVFLFTFPPLTESYFIKDVVENIILDDRNPL